MAAPPRPAPTPCSTAEIEALGRELGLAAVGVATADPLLRARQALEHRRAIGLDGGMAFTYKNPERSTTPTAAVRGARSIIVGARSYLIDEPEPAEPVGRRSAPLARVARYAWVDHYAPLKAALWGVAHHLRAAGWKAVAFADDNSIVDREAAWLAGVGWFGKNANLLLPRAGSWFVLGSVITDAPLEPNATPVADGCGSCRRCLDACPTAAIVAPGTIDANRCLAWLLQKPGVFPVEHRIALGDRIYGCDDCQDVCPPTVRFAPSSPAIGTPTPTVPVLELLGATDAELLARYGRWYLHDREPRWLRRNALIVLGNTGDGCDEAVAAALAEYLGHPDPILRAHAVWAAARLLRHDLLPDTDRDTIVCAELHAVRGTL